MNPESLNNSPAGGRVLWIAARPPARFSSLLRAPGNHQNRKQKPKRKTIYTKFFTKPRPMTAASLSLVEPDMEIFPHPALAKVVSSREHSQRLQAQMFSSVHTG